MALLDRDGETVVTAIEAATSAAQQQHLDVTRGLEAQLLELRKINAQWVIATGEIDPPCD